MWRALILPALFVLGCGHQIGDPCKSNVECSPLGDRFCDIASPGGYCTIESCNSDSCPSESVCVRFFTPLADEVCSFDPALPLGRSDCPHPDERCVCDASDGNGVCLGNAGHCAPSASERRWCQRRCGANRDCRAGYECRQTGNLGAEPIPTFDLGAGQPAKFCAPNGQPS